MNKKANIVLIALLLCVFSIDKFQLTSVSKIPLKQGLPQGVIHITSDSEFTNYLFEGDGSEENPFLIENLEINSQTQGGIYIEGTSKQVIIQNCTIFSLQYGILIRSVQNKSVIIKDNTCSVMENDYIASGITVYNSDGIEILNNTCVSCYNGIDISNGDGLVISKNNISHNLGGGIAVSSLTNSIVKKNFCYNNSFRGISIFGCNDVIIEQNTCINNTNTQYPGEVFEYTEGIGISLASSEKCIIDSNLCSYNGFVGIATSWSKYVIIYNNSIEANVVGIIINIETIHSSTSTGIALVYNFILDNIQFGIYMENYVRECLIYSNILIGNNKEGVYNRFSDSLYTSQAVDKNLKKNKWYDVSNKIGNFWSDRINESVYMIDGVGNEDPYPIASLDEMEIPNMPDFPRGMWFPSTGFYTIRITFVFVTPIVFLTSLYLIIKKSRKSEKISARFLWKGL